MEPQEGLLLCGHGSRNETAVREFLEVTDALQMRLPDSLIGHGFLEICEPDLNAALLTLYQKGCRRISILPGLLFAAGHLKKDIPDIVASFQTSHPDCDVRLARELGDSEDLIDAAVSRIVTGVDQIDRMPVAAKETAVLAVARGSGDEAALELFRSIAADLKSRTGVGEVFPCYASIAQPKFEEGLEDICSRGYKRILLLPWFLFTGIIINRLSEQFHSAKSAWPDIEFTELTYFGNDPAVSATLSKRYLELQTDWSAQAAVEKENT